MFPQEKETFDYLREIGCCKICSVRYLGLRKLDIFKDIDTFLTENNFEEERAHGKCPKTNPCIACLGLFQKIYIEESFQKMIQEILNHQYDNSIFNCALSLPITIYLRAHAVWQALCEKFPTISHNKQEIYVTSIKDIWKLIIGNELATLIDKSLDTQNNNLSITFTLTYPEETKECECLTKMHQDIYKSRQQHSNRFHNTLFTRKSVEQILPATAPEHFKKYYSVPPEVPSEIIFYDQICFLQNPLYIAGRYNKYSRQLCQTPWFIDGERRMDSSVQEIICRLLEHQTLAESGKFIAAGREDVDVRMLGSGRPFVCELINPRKTKFAQSTITELESIINESTNIVRVRGLTTIPKEHLFLLKEGEEMKTKIYQCICFTLESITDEQISDLNRIKDLKILQKTPIRVLHRRPLAIRTKIIHSVNFTRTKLKNVDNGTALNLEIKTQAGTYIKEFVHGDFGRTKPNLCSLLGGIKIDILALDVQEISLEWP